MSVILPVHPSVAGSARKRGAGPMGLGRRWRRGGRRGVSDVVATILILALTVVLFASLFAFVSRFPAPPAQAVNQFQATVTRSATAITGVSILQSGGPPVPSSDRVYLESSRTTTDWQFSQASGVPVAWGIGNATGGWGTGQYWTETFKTPVTLPANITIYIVSSSQLLYTGVVPGSAPNAPPILTSTSTVPATPAVGAAFQIVAIVSGNTANLTLNISLSEVPGLPSSVQAMHPYGTGEWVYNVSAGLTTKNGTYLGFIQGVNNTGSTLSGSVTITLPSTGGSGSGGGSSAPSASVSVVPSPPVIRTNATFTTSISNPGSSALTVSNVTFYVNSSASNHTNFKTLYPPKTATLPTIASHQSAGVTSTLWMVPPALLGAQNLTVLVTFSSGAHALGASITTFGVAPFSASVSEFSQNNTLKTNGTWNILVSVANFGSLGGSTVNVTVYVNNTTGAKSPVGSVFSPAGTKGSSTGVGYATLSTATIGTNTSSTFVAQWSMGGKTTRSASTVSVQVVVVIKNGAWSSFTVTSLTLSTKSTPPVAAIQFTT